MSDYDGEMCTCGCGLSADAAILEAMRGPAAPSRDQAEASFDAAQSARAARISADTGTENDHA